MAQETISCGDDPKEKFTLKQLKAANFWINTDLSKVLNKLGKERTIKSSGLNKKAKA